MNSFGRRDFLKGLLSTAAVLQIPVELIEKATRAIELSPDIPITVKNPTCYVAIDDLLIPVGYISLDRNIGDVSSVYIPSFGKPGRFNTVCRTVVPDDGFTLAFSTNKDYFREYSSGDRVKIAVVIKEIPIVSGYGYFSEFSYEGQVLGEEIEEFCYSYTLNGQVKIE